MVKHCLLSQVHDCTVVGIEAGGLSSPWTSNRGVLGETVSVLCVSERRSIVSERRSIVCPLRLREEKHRLRLREERHCLSSASRAWDGACSWCNLDTLHCCVEICLCLWREGRVGNNA